MANENKTTSWNLETQEQSNIRSKIKWFFQKSNNSKDQSSQRKTKMFHLTHKDFIVSLVVSLLVVCWAIYYWKIVMDEYADINNDSDKLKSISSYDVTLDWEKLFPYMGWDDFATWTISWILSINKTIEEKIVENEINNQRNKGYFDVLLKNIYLPSLNVWKDPYTQNFDMWILGQRYLESDKFQDLYLIQYWSDFAKYVWNDADYNTINNITIGDKVVMEEYTWYFYIPVTISFSSPNKRSFLLLVNKLSMTSNQNNIALLNEFFSILLKNIREDKKDLINQLAQEYRWEFSSSTNWEFPTNFDELTEEQLSIYEDRVIWYTLYHWIQNDKENIPVLVDDDIIIKTIKRIACTNDDLDKKCFYNFRDKYRNLPYLAYKIGIENENNRTEKLLEFLQDLPPAIAITNFGFEKYSNSSFLNNKEEEYEWQITFNAYWKNISDSELEEASLMLWKLCFWDSTEKNISPEQALKEISETISSIGWEDGNKNVTSLSELQSLFTLIQNQYGSMNNYDKMIKLFEIRRMMNDANICKK